MALRIERGVTPMPGRKEKEQHMKHKTLRTLLCVILTVCFCLSAIAPVSAAGLFSGDTGAASIFDEWIRSLKDRFIEKNPGTDETPAEPMAGAGEEFIRIFHLDCGRKYFTVAEIEGIIDQLAANHYTHIELAFGNDGFRFLLDENTLGDITVEGKTYTAKAINEAIHNANVAYCEYKTGSYELTQSDMDEIITYATQKGIGVIPLLNIPGHTNTLVNAMSTLGVPVSAFVSNTNSKGYPTKAFDVDNEATVAFVEAFVANYVEYFGSKGSAYFNIGADECGYDNFTEKHYTKLADMLKTIIGYMKPYKMTPFMFNDGLRTTNALADLLKDQGIVVCFWEMQTSKKYYTATQLDSIGFKVINTHNKWYYVAGNGYATGYDWNNYAYHYDWALNNIKSNTTTDGGSCLYIDGESSNTQTMPVGCMLAYWCDNPKAAYNDTDNASSNGIYSNVCPRNETTTEVQRVKNLIKALADDNPNYFKAAEETPLPTIVIGGNSTELTVGENVIMSTSDGSLAAWSSSNPDVLTLKDNDAVEKALLSETSSVTVQAVGAGEAAITAVLGNGNTISTAPIKVKTAATAGVEEINVTVGGTATHTQTNENFSANKEQIRDTSGNVIAEYSAEYKNIPGGTERKLGAKRSSSGDCVISDGNGNYLVIDKSGNITNTTEINQATVITYSISSNSYSFRGNGYYLTTEWSNGSYNLKATTSNSTWQYSSNNSGYHRYYNYLRFDNGSWTVAYASSNAGYPYSFTETTTLPTQGTVVTFTGLAAGNATVTIGNTTYTINVTAEDLSGVTPLPIQTWVTNNAVELNAGKYTTVSKYTTESYYPNWANPGVSNYQYAKYVEVNANAELNTASGIHIQDLMPDSVKGFEYANTYWKSTPSGKTATEQELVVWSGRVHTASANNIQKIAQDDFSNSGTEFYYIRYFNGKWAVSKDGSINSWIEVDGTNTQSTEQIVVYYMVRTKITNEVTTDVADWGKPKGSSDYDSQVGGNFVLLDFAVKYEGGTRNPDIFPVESKTLAYHCASGDAAVGTDNGTNYRKLFNFRGIETSDYEVYMVTVTMTNDSASTQLTSSNAKTKNGYTYAGEEKVVWAIDTDTYNKSGLNPYESLSGNYSFDVTDTKNCIGGDPYVRGVDVYNKHGALITYYIRAVQKKDSLTVNYFVEGVDTPFYSYFINVDANATHGKNKFDEAIALNTETATSWKGNLVHGDVINIKDNTEWVSANLETMPAIGAQYRFSKYECVRVVRESDKVVNLYYKFTANASFVVDFGLPITITPADLSQNLTNANITGAFVSNTPYANVKMDGKNIIYQLNKPLDRVDTFTIKYKGTNLETLKEGEATFTINIIPATNMLYEENFMAAGEGWTKADSAATNAKQDLEPAGAKTSVYGYDKQVAKWNDEQENTTSFSMGSAYKADLTLPSGSKFVNAKGKITFTFEGTGFDLISNCGKNTGILQVSVVNDEGKQEKAYIVDTYLHGDDTVLTDGTMTYQVPVVRAMNLPYDTYTVTVYGSLWSSSGAVTQPSVPKSEIPNAQTASLSLEEAVSAETVDVNAMVREMLDSCGMENVSLDEVELVYMDENSILNGGTGMEAKTSVVTPVAELFSMNRVSVAAENETTATGANATVFVDAFRVYNPLGVENGASIGDKTEAGATDHAYKLDKESGVMYTSLYDSIKENTSTTMPNNAVMYVEYSGELGTAQIKEYKTWGPENEIYLAPGQGIAFGVKIPENEDYVLQISAKFVNDQPVLEIGEGMTPIKLNGTEMYYDISTYVSGENEKYVVIKNAAEATGDVASPNAVLAISGLKYKNVEFKPISETTKQLILKSFAKQTVTSFEPEYFVVFNLDTARKNRNFAFSIAASASDVKTVTIQMMTKDGVENESSVYTLTPNNTKAVEAGITSNHSYSKVFRIKEAGTYTFDIVAYNENGLSKTITKTVVVK